MSLTQLLNLITPKNAPNKTAKATLLSSDISQSDISQNEAGDFAAAFKTALKKWIAPPNQANAANRAKPAESANFARVASGETTSAPNAPINKILRDISTKPAPIIKADEALGQTTGATGGQTQKAPNAQKASAQTPNAQAPIAAQEPLMKLLLALTPRATQTAQNETPEKLSGAIRENAQTALEGEAIGAIESESAATVAIGGKISAIDADIIAALKSETIEGETIETIAAQTVASDEKTQKLTAPFSAVSGENRQTPRRANNESAQNARAILAALKQNAQINAATTLKSTQDRFREIGRDGTLTELVDFANKNGLEVAKITLAISRQKTIVSTLSHSAKQTPASDKRAPQAQTAADLTKNAKLREPKTIIAPEKTSVLDVVKSAPKSAAPLEAKTAKTQTIAPIERERAAPQSADKTPIVAQKNVNEKTLQAPTIAVENGAKKPIEKTPLANLIRSVETYAAQKQNAKTAVNNKTEQIAQNNAPIAKTPTLETQRAKTPKASDENITESAESETIASNRFSDTLRAKTALDLQSNAAFIAIGGERSSAAQISEG
ncbi:MAG: hypothetical protein LBO72_09935, partial [Helicobacteraceae bacterium]|nr:hypothetical protein [Helicobacteraceae bacterium]